MLDQNTDRMWFVIGAVIVGAAIIFIANGTLPDIFASVGESMEQALVGTDLFSRNLIIDPNLRYMENYYNLEPGIKGRTSPIATTVYDDVMGRVVHIETFYENQGVFYRDKSTTVDVELLEEGKTYRMEVTLRADEPIEVGIAMDGGRLSRADIYTLSSDWNTYVLEGVTNGINTRPRVYTTGAGEYYIANMAIYEVE